MSKDEIRTLLHDQKLALPDGNFFVTKVYACAENGSCISSYITNKDGEIISSRTCSCSCGGQTATRNCPANASCGCDCRSGSPVASCD